MLMKSDICDHYIQNHPDQWIQIGGLFLPKRKGRQNNHRNMAQKSAVKLWEYYGIMAKL